MSPELVPLQAAHELHQRKETPPQEHMTLLLTTLMSHPYALLLIHTYSPILHPSVQGATEESLDLEGGPPEALALRGSLVHPNKWGRFTKVKLTECSPSPHQNRQRLEV